MDADEPIDIASIQRVYKICPAKVWNDALARGSYLGSADDAKDGFMHLSSAEQLRATADKHFAGQEGLLLIAVKASDLGAELKWEISRGGKLFPHLYGGLPISAVAWTAPLPLGRNGLHILPDLHGAALGGNDGNTGSGKPTPAGKND